MPPPADAAPNSWATSAPAPAARAAPRPSPARRRPAPAPPRRRRRGCDRARRRPGDPPAATATRATLDRAVGMRRAPPRPTPGRASDAGRKDAANRACARPRRAPRGSAPRISCKHLTGREKSAGGSTGAPRATRARWSAAASSVANTRPLSPSGEAISSVRGAAACGSIPTSSQIASRGNRRQAVDRAQGSAGPTGLSQIRGGDSTPPPRRTLAARSPRHDRGHGSTDIGIGIEPVIGFELLVRCHQPRFRTL